MIINRYLFKEIALSFLATLLVLTLVIVGNTFVRLLADASAGQLPSDVIGQMLFYGSAKNTIKLVPVALLIGMMLAFSRLYQDSEMMVFQASGISPRSFYKAVFTFVTPLTILMLYLVLSAMPYLEKRSQEIRLEVNERPESAGIPPGSFVTSKTGTTNYSLLAEDINETNTTMERFFVHAESKKDNTEILIWAKTAILFIDSISGDRMLQINNGKRYELDQNKKIIKVVDFQEHGVRIPLLDRKDHDQVKAKPTLELFKFTHQNYIGELHWRIAIIISTPMLALLAYPLSHTRPRQGRFGKIALGILIYTLYANLLISGKSMLDKGTIPSWLGLWWIHTAMLAYIFWLIRHKFGRAR